MHKMTSDQNQDFRPPGTVIQNLTEYLHIPTNFCVDKFSIGISWIDFSAKKYFSKTLCQATRDRATGEIYELEYLQKLRRNTRSVFFCCWVWLFSHQKLTKSVLYRGNKLIRQSPRVPLGFSGFFQKIWLRHVSCIIGVQKFIKIVRADFAENPRTWLNRTNLTESVVQRVSIIRANTDQFLEKIP